MKVYKPMGPKRARPIPPNKTRRVAQCRREYYRESNRAKIPLRHFLERDRDYPYRTRDGRIDCNLVSAAIKRARLNQARGVAGSTAVLKRAKAIWNRVCRKYTADASQ